MKSTNTQPLLWGIIHFLNDLVAGFMLAHYTFVQPHEQALLFMLIYSIIGFGGQLPVGFWLDHNKQIRPFATVSLLLLPMATGCFFINAETGIILSGLASAFIHVTGGAVCLQVNENKTGPLALFTAPGVLGLTIGGLAGAYSSSWLLAALLLTIIIAVIILRSKLPVYQPQPKKQSELDGHDWLMLGILLLMCFRSFLFDVLNHVAQQYQDGLLILGVSAFAGKIIGGFVADRIGWKKYVYISLPLALLLFQFGKDNIYALAFGIACLQSSVPITLLLMSQSLRLYPATATALSLGASVAIAGLPLYMMSAKSVVLDWFKNSWISAGAFILLAALLLLLLKYINQIREIKSQN